MIRIPTGIRIFVIAVLVAGGLIVTTPFLFGLILEQKQSYALSENQFPVTVDPQKKLITEDPIVNAFLEGPSSPLAASAENTSEALWRVFAWIATTISNAPWYESIASVEGRVVTIAPGMRKEQVAMIFGKALLWNDSQKKAFLTARATSSLPLLEGSFLSGAYFVDAKMSPQVAQALVNERFSKEILSRYGTSTARIVPLQDALIIASLIQRETIGTSDMRLVSGIIWNRLFRGMKLQIDATLQYAKANTTSAVSWWPKVVPADARRKSPYNTYLHAGLPPTPIASPSVAAVLAALNPLDTPCLFYFNDAKGNILCTNTYAEHVALLKQYYGRGK